jgi:hypothetical protein
MMGTATRRAWLAVGSLFAVATLAFGTFQMVSLVGRATETASSSFDNVRHLTITNGAGSVRLVAAPGATTTTTVRRTIDRRLVRPSYHERMDGDRLVLDASCDSAFSSWCDVHLEVSVPAGVDVDVSASGGGIRADGLDAPLKLRSSGGGITVVGGGSILDLDSSGGGVRVDATRAGTVTAHSSGGGVTITYAAVPGTVDARSSGGGVTVEVPDGLTAYRVDASSSGGSAHTLVRTDPTSDHLITARSSGGGVTVRYLSAT